MNLNIDISMNVWLAICRLLGLFHSNSKCAKLLLCHHCYASTISVVVDATVTTVVVAAAAACFYVPFVIEFLVKNQSSIHLL